MDYWGWIFLGVIAACVLAFIIDNIVNRIKEIRKDGA
jgi:hypothetical protein